MIPLNTGLVPRRLAPTVRCRLRPTARILVIDDEVTFIRAYRRLLGAPARRRGGPGEEALAILAATGLRSILCDLMMPGTDGVGVYEGVARLHPGSFRVVFSGGAPTAPRSGFLPT
jgi:CheY-like chemotaxis protein